MDLRRTISDGKYGGISPSRPKVIPAFDSSKEIQIENCKMCVLLVENASRGGNDRSLLTINWRTPVRGFRPLRLHGWMALDWHATCGHVEILTDNYELRLSFRRHSNRGLLKSTDLQVVR